MAIITENFSTKLGEIQKTLFLPLLARAMEAQKDAPLLVDQAAVEIIRKLPFDPSALLKGMSEVTTFGWIRRALLTDRVIRDFIEKHPNATVVNIGCGLDTTFERIDNGKIRWYDLDLPEVVELRRKLIPENKRRQLISGSFLEQEWLNNLVATDHVLFMAAGLFYYFEEGQIKDFLHRLADRFPGSEVIFDATSPIGLGMANKMVLRKAGMDERLLLQWGLKVAETIASWDSRLKILDEEVFFKNAKQGKPLLTKIALWLSDRLKMQYMVHVKIAISSF